MVDFSELIEMGSEPENFEEYLDRYATRVGELVNAYIPKGSHPDMDKYLYTPMLEFSRNGGKRHRPLRSRRRRRDPGLFPTAVAVRGGARLGGTSLPQGFPRDRGRDP